MRDRTAAAARKIGFAGDLSELTVSTIHGFCNKLLTQHRHRTDLGHSFETLDELTQLLFIFEHFDEIIGPAANDLYLGRWSTRWTAIEGARELHQVPFDLLIDGSGKRLLDSHVVSYIPSGSVLAIIRGREQLGRPRRLALAVSASPPSPATSQMNGGPQAAIATVSRGVYDLDGGTLPPLPSADDEARSVATILSGTGTKVLIGTSATERELKQEPLFDYRVLHFAAHGIVSTKYPARSALVLRAGDGEDGLLQAREILDLRLRAELVTLSACDTGNGDVYGQEGVASLVRPFLAAGAHTVVANLWSADDTFSLALMREFYSQLAHGLDKGESLRQAKLAMIRTFGPQAVPRLWSGVVMYGDSAGRIQLSGDTIH